MLIHQFIFAAPRPGWVAERFQNYWLNQHAVGYASKIRQIRRYSIAPRLRLPASIAREVPAFEGVAEIWMEESEQINSLLSDEFLRGARLDEPNWAAFWMTFVHESYSEVTRGADADSDSLFKIYFFIKRRTDLDLEMFRKELRGKITEAAHAIPGVIRRTLAPARDALYGLGEPRFDALDVLGFATQRHFQAALGTNAWKLYLQELAELSVDRHLFTFTGRDHWIIRPGER